LAERRGQAPGTNKILKNQRPEAQSKKTVYRPLCTSRPCNRFHRPSNALILRSSLLRFAKEQFTCPPHGSSEIVNQFLALSHERTAHINFGKLERFSDFRAGRMRVTYPHIIGTSNRAKDAASFLGSNLLRQDILKEPV
jgi:hypothetical protein